METLTFLDEVMTLFIGLADNTTDDLLDDPTPCDGWQVRHLFGHAIGAAYVYANVMQGTNEMVPGSTPPDLDRLGSLVGGDHRAAVRGALAHLRNAGGAVDDLDAPATTFWAEGSLDWVLRMWANDFLVHCWDLATATGQDLAVPDDLAQAGLDVSYDYVVEVSRPAGRVGPVIAAPAGATTFERLVTHYGRSV